MLTPKQHQLFTFINKALLKTGICPSFEEMKEEMGLKSKSGIHKILTALRDRGFISYGYAQARSIQVLKLPTSAGVTIRSAQMKEMQQEIDDLKDHVRDLQDEVMQANG